MADELDDGDNRYAHLLKPLRDLASNWNIDIANDLRGYLADLEGISFELEGVPTKLNFAQAALLIQGSAAVYSKKVEYLYDLILQAIGQIQGKQAAEGVKQRQKKPGAAQPDFDDDGDLLLLDENMEEGGDIDLDEGDLTDLAEGDRQGPITLPFSFAPGGDASEAAEFKMNTCVITQSGALLLGQNLDLLNKPQTRRASMSAGAGQLLSPAGRPNRVNAEEEDNDGSVITGPVKGDATKPTEQQQQPSQQPQANKVVGEVDGGEDSDEEMEDHEKASKAPVAKLKGDQQRAYIGMLPASSNRNPWETLDPHSATSIPAKPFKKGKTYRKAKPKTQEELEIEALNPKKDKGAKASMIHFSPLLPMDLTVGNFLKPIYSELQYIYDADVKKRNNQRKKARDLHIKSLMEAGDIEAVIAEEDEFEDHTTWGAVGADVVDDGGDGGYDDYTAAETTINNLMEGIAADTQAEFLLQADGNMNFMDLCQAYVDKYFAEAENYFVVSDLTTRVSQWSQKLQPLLDEQESRPVFDIHESGAMLIQAFDDKPTETHKPEASFADLCKPTQGYEVARNFAAMLELVNKGNVELIARPAKLNAVADLKIRLLDTNQRKEILAYRLPTDEPNTGRQDEEMEVEEASTRRESVVVESDDEEEKPKKAKRGKAKLAAPKPKAAAATNGRKSKRSSQKENLDNVE